MKQYYQNPTTTVIEIQQTQMFCISEIKKVESGEVGITYGNAGSSEAARVKGNSVDWHEDWSEQTKVYGFWELKDMSPLEKVLKGL